MKYKAAPGTYLAQEVKDTNKIVINPKNTRILKGKVIDVGEDEITEFGIKIEMPVKVGDIVYFLSYEGDYDNIRENNKKIYTVLRKDHRFIQK